MFTDLSLQIALGSVPSSQTSHYRSSMWFRQSGQVPSLPISYYRSLLIRKMKKKSFKGRKINFLQTVMAKVLVDETTKTNFASKTNFAI